MADTIEQIFEEIVGGAPENVVAFPRPVDEEFDDMEHTFRKLALGGSDGTQVLGNAYNAGLILMTDPRVNGVLGYDDFRGQTVIMSDIDTGVECVPTVRVRGVEQLSAHHLDALMAFMQAPAEARGEVGGHGCSVTRQSLEVGVSNAARRNTFDPVKQLIEREEWDGKPRLDTWISRYLGTSNDVYHREIGVKWMTAAVARVYEPGAKFDFTLTVRGDQGTRKSTMFEVLGRDFYTSLGVGAMKDEKKLIEATAGSWIVEIAEMAAMQSNSADANKNFISTTVDKARMAYDRITSDHRRRFVFGITTNNRGIIDDPTGARRFWIVDVAKAFIDTDALAAEVGQMWAEALHIYREMRAAQPAGNLPLFLSTEASAIADAKQSSSRAYDDIDALADEIRNVIETPRIDGDGEAFGARFYTEYAPKEIFAAVTGRPMSEYASGKTARDLLKACRRIEYLSAPGDRRYIKRIGEKAKPVIVDREKFLAAFASRLRDEGYDLSAYEEREEPAAPEAGDDMGMREEKTQEQETPSDETRSADLEDMTTLDETEPEPTRPEIKINADPGDWVANMTTL